MNSARLVFLASVFLLIGVTLRGAEHYVQTNIGVCSSWACLDPQAPAAWDSGAYVESRLLGHPYAVGMRNSHTVYEDNTTVVGWSGYNQGFWSDWQGYLVGGPRMGHCYNAHLDSTAGSSVKDVPSSPWRVCWSGSGGEGDELEQEGNCPIVLNPGDGPWRLSGMNDAVSFDLDADGVPERMGWTARGTALAFLASDWSGNGRIDDGEELFGVGTLMPDGSRAINGFDALRQHDRNLDGVIDRSDSIWRALLLWTDRNHDARSQPHELRSIKDSEITALEFAYRETRRHDVHGNAFRYRANSRVGRTRQPFYDIFFVGER